MRLVEEQSGEALSSEAYFSTLGNGVDEVVRSNLRGLSQEGSGFGHWRQLLMRASERSKDQLTRAFQAQGLAFDLSPYLTHARKSLEVAARELFALNKKLIDSKLKREYQRNLSSLPPPLFVSLALPS